MLDKTTYMNWLSEFFNTKSNDLQYAITQQPKRMEKITLDLSVATVNAKQIDVPFKTMIISRIYSTATPATDKSGQIAISFDQDNLANLKNSINLFPNDTLRSGTLVSKSFLTWTAQSDTSIDIYFYPDIEVVAGTTKTQIVGTVTVANTYASPLFVKPFKPSSTQRLFSNNSGTSSYTIPAGFYGIVKCLIQSAAGTNYLLIAGANILDSSQAAGQYRCDGAFAYAGEVVQLTNSASGYSFAQIDLYPL